MARKSKAKFTMSGHTLPGINQKSETVNIKDGRSPSSAFQMKEAGDSPLPLPKWMKTAGRVGLGLATGGMSEVGIQGFKGIKNLFNKGGGGDTTGDATGSDDAEAGKKLLKEEAKAEMEGDTAMAMKLHTGKKKQ